MKKIIKKMIELMWNIYIELLGFWYKITGKTTITVFDNNILISKKICIFYGYQNNLSILLEKHLCDLLSRKFKIIYVTNLILNRPMLDALSKYVDIVIQRPNYGRDFSGYKAGYNYLIKSGIEQCDELLFTNDTVIYPIINADQFWDELRASESKVVGPFISYQRQMHIQSFFILCKDRIHLSDAFKNFWSEYSEPNSRDRVIKHGEIGFSNHLSLNGIRFDGVVDAKSITNISTKTINNDLIPEYFKRLYSKFDPALYQYQHNNPSHLYALFSVKYFNVPLVKKDLLSRGTFSLTEFFIKMNHLDTIIDKEEMRIELIKKGLPSFEDKFRNKVLSWIGAI
ncbi:rhamnan synthesis F family protein [Polynucleobacter sp. Fuers-14]|uniref:rhamnan synthesis F family protein n=1 Tax=Polynucleobacter sp. Fuers-14 TaxID=1758364 RepID=UPI001C0E1A4A|nr:rhamnan synthesis F family protein [Polynucleobacter sp. Fuers-14]MBU3641077.1 hypothetical protein [Polynucleobacter sp. Fuers-14]